MVASAVALVLAGGALGMSVMMGYANHHYVVANAAADLRTNLSELADLNGDFARAVTAPGAATRSKVLQDQLLGNLAVIDSSGYNGDDMEGLKDEVSVFLARSTEIRRAASQGNLQAATALDAQDDATFGTMSADATVGMTELPQSASKAIRDVRLGVLALATLVVVTVAGALLWDARRRRSVAEQRVEAESRTRFEAMVEGGSDLLALTDAAGNRIYVEPGSPSRAWLRAPLWRRDGAHASGQPGRSPGCGQGPARKGSRRWGGPGQSTCAYGARTVPGGLWK